MKLFVGGHMTSQITLKKLFAIVSFVAINIVAVRVDGALAVMSIPLTLVLLGITGTRVALYVFWGLVLGLLAVSMASRVIVDF